MFNVVCGALDKKGADVNAEERDRNLTPGSTWYMHQAGRKSQINKKNAFSFGSPNQPKLVVVSLSTIVQLACWQLVAQEFEAGVAIWQLVAQHSDILTF